MLFHFGLGTVNITTSELIVGIFIVGILLALAVRGLEGLSRWIALSIAAILTYVLYPTMAVTFGLSLIAMEVVCILVFTIVALWIAFRAKGTPHIVIGWVLAIVGVVWVLQTIAAR